MASGNGCATGGIFGRGRPSADVSAGEQTQDLGWIPIAFGAAAIVAGLGGRKKGTAALALTAVEAGAVRGYDMFKHHTDGCVRAVFAP